MQLQLGLGRGIKSGRSGGGSRPPHPVALVGCRELVVQRQPFRGTVRDRELRQKNGVNGNRKWDDVDCFGNKLFNSSTPREAGPRVRSRS